LDGPSIEPGLAAVASSHAYLPGPSLFARSTLKLQLFLDFREIEKRCTEIEKSLVSERWVCENIGTFDSEINVSQSLNQIQMLKDCLLHHVYCAHLATPWHRAVTTFCTVSYRESRYTRTDYGCDLESLRVFFVVSVSRQEDSSV